MGDGGICSPRLLIVNMKAKIGGLRIAKKNPGEIPGFEIISEEIVIAEQHP